MTEAEPQDAQPQDAEPKEDLPHCKCGTTRDSKFAVVEHSYSFLGMLYMIWGGTATPTMIKFRCIKCQRYFDESTALSVRMAYRNRA